MIDPWFRSHEDLPAFRWNFARCLAEVGRPLAALDSYRLMAALDVPRATHEAAEAAIGQLRQTRLGRISVACEPADARVTIEGIGPEPVPCPLDERDIAAGAHRVVVTSPGGVSWQRDVEVDAGRLVELRARLGGVLRVESPVAGAHVQVDGRYSGVASPDDPLVVHGLHPGRHAIRATPTSGGPPWGGVVHLRAGEISVVTAAIDVGPPVGPAPAPASVAAGDTRPGARPEAEATDDDDDTLIWVGIGAGAGVIALGAALLLASDEAPARPRAAVPVIGERP